MAKGRRKYYPHFRETILRAKDGVPPRAGQFVFLRIGRITRIDIERFAVDIDFDDGTKYQNVTITQSSGGLTSGVVSIPDINSRVICGFLRDDFNAFYPIILQAFPVSPKQAYAHDLFFNKNVEIKNENELTERLWRPRLYPGESAIYSTAGSLIECSDDVFLRSAEGLEFGLRSDDQVAFLSALNKFDSTAAGRRYSGIIKRTIPFLESSNSTVLGNALSIGAVPAEDLDLPINDLVTASREYYGIQPSITPSGRVELVVTPLLSGKRPNFEVAGKAYVEDRLEMREYHDGVQDIVDLIHGYDADFLLDPRNTAELKRLLYKIDRGRLESQLKGAKLVERVVGTFVGRDIGQPDKYARVLRRKTFSGWQPTGEATETSSADRATFNQKPEFIPCESDEEEYNLAETFALLFPSSTRAGGLLETAFTVNKEGKVQVAISSSSNVDPIAAGISVEAILDGALKMAVGRMRQSKEGIRLLEPFLKGYSDDTFEGGQSASWDYDGSYNIKVRRPDDSGTGFSIDVTGDLRSLLRGHHFEQITGNRDIRVDGRDALEVGSQSLIVNGEKKDFIDGRYEKTVNKESDTLIQGGKVERVKGGIVNVVSDDQNFEFNTNEEFDGGIKTLVNGPVTEEIAGSKTEIISGELERTYSGGFSEAVTGSCSRSVMGTVAQHITTEMSDTSGGSQQRQSYVGTQIDLYTGKPVAFSDLVYTTGSILREILIAGDIRDTTLAGDVTYQTVAGNATLQTLGGIATVQGTALAQLIATLGAAIVQGTTATINTFSLPGSVKIGSDAAALGLVIAEQLALIFNTHVHSAVGLGAPTTPPLVPMIPSAISSTVAKVSA